MSACTKRSSTLLEFEGANFLRARLQLATLSGRSIRIRKIRQSDQNPGLHEAEASLIRLIDKLTNGSRIEVNETGTELFYQPGLLVGGKVEHDCNPKRGIGYYLEPILGLAGFCKTPLQVTLRGVTNNQLDPSPDLLRNSALPILKRFLVADDEVELKVLRRGAAPGGGGHVIFKCPIRKSIRANSLLDQGKIKRIRGAAWATRVSPAVANRLIEAAKGILLNYLPDIYIYSDHLTGPKSGNSPGFGLTLTAETTSGIFLSSEVTSNPSGSDLGPTVPEDLATQGAHMLLEEIYRGGCVDSTCQSLHLMLMVLTQRDVSKVVTGPLSNYSVQFLRHLRDFFEVTFKIENVEVETKENEDGTEEELRIGAPKVQLSCMGIGYTNLSKRTA